MKRIIPLLALLLASSFTPSKAEDGAALAVTFQNEVDRRLEVPQEVREHYAEMLEGALTKAELLLVTAQYLLVLDRNPNVQAIFLYWLDPHAAFNRLHFIGATPVSTGKPGEYEHFITPLGVFAHSLEHKDYRAEGTLNGYGIRGLGRKGMRVFDFGWVQAERGWGKGGISPMRLLLHATDPDRLEKYLGEAMSKGCIRIPAMLNDFIDRYGLLDADYEQRLATGKELWVMRADRLPTQWPGRYLVIVDSGSYSRPDWSPKPVVETHKTKSKNKKRVPAVEANQ